MTCLENADYYIYLMDFPPKVHSFVTPNSDGTYSLYLDAKKSRLEQLQDYEHELAHIENEDFYNGKDISEVESF